MIKAMTGYRGRTKNMINYLLEWWWHDGKKEFFRECVASTRILRRNYGRRFQAGGACLMRRVLEETVGEEWVEMSFESLEGLLDHEVLVFRVWTWSWKCWRVQVKNPKIIQSNSRIELSGACQGYYFGRITFISLFKFGNTYFEKLAIALKILFHIIDVSNKCSFLP